MSTLLQCIAEKLNSPQIAENLTPLFCEVLGWGRPTASPRCLSVSAPVGRQLTVRPVAELSSVPVFRVDWHLNALPTVTQRRAVHRALMPIAVEHLLCYITQDKTQAAFVWARKRSDGKVELRTLPYEVGAPARTTIERLSELAFTLDELGALGAPPVTAVLDKLNRAFDVEAVNRDFFARYERCFYNEVKPAVKKALDGDNEAAHQFTQLLFNRLMFCWFLQKKGWLNNDPDYLLNLLRRAHSYKPPKNLYHDYLTFLFFEVLANPEEKRRKRHPSDPHIVMEAPFLNGGLFERTPLDERVESASRFRQLPNSVFKAILEDLFARYNFTVEESTSLDVQVALDPELLGTIFERLVTGRHETGSYYTPKPVVEFMCREALAAYLKSQIPHLKPDIVDALVFEHDVSDLSLADANDIVRALDTIKVCDPACGSGAYLVTMLHELVAIYRALYSEKLNDPQKDYDLKLRIIERNLYGVDIDPFAINIARLRLWLTLIVDSEETDWRKVKPLPNLDFKIKVGDSLTAPDPQAMPNLFRAVLIQHADRLAALKGKYLRAYGEEKKRLAQQIAEEERQLREALREMPAPEGALDWRVEFAEVFAPPEPVRTIDGRFGFAVQAMLQPPLPEQPQGGSGFDIVLSNPPYVRADAQFRHLSHDEKARQAAIAKWKDYRASLLKSGIYQTLYEKWDLYLPFLERAYQLLRRGGHMVFIISDAYNAAKYARKSHEFFLKNARIERIDFCTDIPLFEAGVRNTIVRFAKVAPDANHKPLRIRRWGESRDDFERNAEVLPTAPQAELGTAVFKPDTAKPTGTTVRFVPLEMICYISVGMVINANERGYQGAFTADDVLADVRDPKHPKRFVLGKDIVKWCLRNLRFLEWGTRRAPARFRRPTFPELHEAKEKLVAVRTPGAEPKVIYDDDHLHFDASAVGFVPWHLLKGVVNRSISKTAKYRRQDPKGDREEREKISRQFHLKYVLAVMNSTFAKEWLAKRRRSKIHIYPDDWKQLPIALIPMEQQMEFVKFVDAILEEFQKHGYPLPPDAAKRVAELEREIDERVASLYGLK